MNDTVDWRFLFTQSRPRVYLAWAAVTGVGYTATHFYQNPNINTVWTVLSAMAFWYMYRVMPLRVGQMKKIYVAWLVPITFGIAVSVISVRTGNLNELVPYLGAFWLAVSAVGYAWNGYVDPPSNWYYAAAAVNIMAAAVCYRADSILEYQYIIAAAVSVWSLLSLWIFRSDA